MRICQGFNEETAIAILEIYLLLRSYRLMKVSGCSTGLNLDISLSLVATVDYAILCIVFMFFLRFGTSRVCIFWNDISRKLLIKVSVYVWVKNFKIFPKYFSLLDAFAQILMRFFQDTAEHETPQTTKNVIRMNCKMSCLLLKHSENR